MTEALVLDCLDDHEALIETLAGTIIDCHALTEFLDQAAENGNAYPMRLEVDELDSRQRRFLIALLAIAPDCTSRFEKVPE